MYAATFGCMYAPFGCMSMERLGACMPKWVHLHGNFWVHVCGFWVHVYGAVGCIYAVVGCIYALVWVHSMRLLGAKCAVVGCMYAD